MIMETKKKLHFVFGINYFESFQYYDSVDTNKFLSVFNYYKNSSDDQEKYTATYDKNMNNIINAIKNDTKNTSSKRGYIYNINGFYTESNSPVFGGERLEIDFDNFENKVEEIYSLYSRQKSSGEFYFSLSNIYSDEILKEYNIVSVVPIEIRDNNLDGIFELGIQVETQNGTKYEY